MRKMSWLGERKDNPFREVKVNVVVILEEAERRKITTW